MPTLVVGMLFLMPQLNEAITGVTIVIFNTYLRNHPS